MKDNAIIIGGGIGGLSAAIRLSAAGWQVNLIERNNIIGGKMGQWFEDGFRWDTGPSVITMRPVLEDVFLSAGRKIEDYLELIPIEPMTRYHFSDGTCLNLSSNLPTTLEQIARIAPCDVEGYLAFLSYAARLYRLTAPVFTFGPPPSVRSFRSISIWDLPWIGLQGIYSMHDAIASHVSSPYLRQLLGRFATYVGSSPYECAAILSVIAHVELNEGVWYARGGVYSIAQALEKLAKEMGVEFSMGVEVEKIAHSQIRSRNHTSGVELNNGKFRPSKVVIADVDTLTVYKKLLPDNKVFRDKGERLDKYKKSSSGFILLLGVGDVHPELAHHNIFFSTDYKNEFFQIFQERKPPEDPTIYLSITSKTDQNHAPEGCENWFILVNVPANDTELDWNGTKNVYAELILENLEKRGFNIRNKLRVKKIFTPCDLEIMSGARHGALYGVSYNNRMAPFLRPHNRCNLMDGLYFVGGTTHPGGGVPMVMLSAKVVSDMISKDW